MKKCSVFYLLLSFLVISGLLISGVIAQGIMQIDSESDIGNSTSKSSYYNEEDDNFIIESEPDTDNFINESSLYNWEEGNITIIYACCDDYGFTSIETFRAEDIGLAPGDINNLVALVIPVGGEPILFFSIEEYEAFKGIPQIVPFSSHPIWCPGGRVMTTRRLYSACP